VTDLGRPSTDCWPVPQGVVDRPSRLTEVLPVAARSDAETALELARLQPLKAMVAAYEASLVMGLAAHRADEDAHGRSSIPGTSEFYVDELAAVTNSSARAAQRLAFESFVLTERLPPCGGRWPVGNWTGLGTHLPPWLRRPPTCCELRLRCARQSTSRGSVRPHTGAAAVRQAPGPHLPASQLRAAGRPGRPRPRHALSGRRHRLRQPVLPVPAASPAEDPRPRLAVRAHRRRAAAGHHPERDHPHHPAAGSARPDRATGPARATPTRGPARGTTAVLTARSARARGERE
jgi:hypothetical protein